ncbi:transglutaminase domain-containing protein [Flavobacterium humi]|nr:transglutaminase domain-containing protein [Flavobacterium humi]
MKRMYAAFLILLNLSVFAQTPVDNTLYAHALKAPKTTDVKLLARYLSSGPIKSEAKTVETFFYWIAQNIAYDTVLFKKGTIMEEDVTVAKTLKNKKSVCAGYSQLLLELCNAAQIECLIIEGTARYYNMGPNGAGHAWNAVKINGKWELIDTTWGSGYLDDTGKFKKHLDLKYFLADPEFMIIEHFPNDHAWQLMEKPVSSTVFDGKEWEEKRLRLFYNLTDDDAYATYKQRMKQAKTAPKTKKSI